MKVYNLLIDDFIGSELFGEGGITAKYVREEIAKARSANATNIRLVISSPGGDVYEGYSIYNILAGLDIPVDTYVNGLCASIATLIACAGKKIESAKTSQWMFHKPSAGGGGTAPQLESTLEALRQIESKMAEVYALRLGGSMDKALELMNKGDNYLTPEDMKAMGFIDEVVLPIAAFGKLTQVKMKDNNKRSLLGKAFSALEDAINKTMGITAGQEKLADGATILYFEGDLATGKEVFINPEMTEKASPGEHALANGKVLVVDDAGVIVEVREVEATAELTQAKAKITELEATIQKLTNEKNDLQAQITQKNTEVTDIKKDVTALKKLVVNAGVKIKAEDITNEDKKVSPFDGFAEEMKAKYSYSK